MDKFRAIATYIAIVEAGTLTAAAERLGVSLSSVVRSLAELERSLGVRLLNRSTRRLAVTVEGAEYLKQCKDILARLDAIEAATTARQALPSGLLRLTAPVTFGRRHLTPVVAGYLAEHEDMRVDLLLLDRVVDMLEENVDVSLRIGTLPDSSQVAVPLGSVARVVCASPAYLRRSGRPKTPAALRGHRFVAFTGFSAGGAWSFVVNGRPRRVAIEAVLSVNSIDAAVDCCIAGLGIGTFLHYQVRDALGDGRLVRLLEAHECTPVPVNLLVHQVRRLSPRVRSFIDWATPVLRERLEP